jgi:type III secretion protein U
MADSEERNLPPTSSKLRRARRDGKVPHARDVVALSFIPVLLWLIINWRSFEADLKAILISVFAQDYALGADVLVHGIAPMVFRLILWVALPPLIMAAVIGIILSVLDTQGFVFSAKPLAPDFGRINPGDGLKRIFSARTLTDAGFGLVKLLLFAGIAAFVLLAALSALRRLQVCGYACIPQTVSVTIIPLVIGAVALFVAAALIDFVLSRNLFRLEMRMSFTEMKHENKENYGSPEQKRFRRDIGRQFASGTTKLGMGAATLMFEGPDILIAVRYVPSEIRAPVVVAKARGGTRLTEGLELAQRQTIPISRNRALAEILMQRGVVGAIIPKETFTDVANEIVQAERNRQPPTPD